MAPGPGVLRAGEEEGSGRDQTGQADGPHTGPDGAGRQAPHGRAVGDGGLLPSRDALGRPSPWLRNPRQTLNPLSLPFCKVGAWSGARCGTGSKPPLGAASGFPPCRRRPQSGTTPRLFRANLSFSGLMALAPSLLLLGGGPGPTWPSRRSEETQACPPRTCEPTAGELGGPSQRPPTAQRAPLPTPARSRQPVSYGDHLGPTRLGHPRAVAAGLWAGPRGRFSPTAPITHTALPGLPRHRWAPTKPEGEGRVSELLPRAAAVTPEAGVGGPQAQPSRPATALGALPRRAPPDHRPSKQFTCQPPSTASGMGLPLPEPGPAPSRGPAEPSRSPRL